MVWVSNRLADGATVHGYRDVLLLLTIDGHVCELQLHLRPLYEQDEDGHAAYAIARLLETAGEHYEGERNGNGEYHGQGKLTWANGDFYEGKFSKGKSPRRL